MSSQMDEAMDAIIRSRQVPDVPVNFVPAKGGDIIKLGPITCRVLEDGSRTGIKAYTDIQLLNIKTLIQTLRQSHRSCRVHTASSNQRTTGALA
jgi:hypothetical protein